MMVSQVVISTGFSLAKDVFLPVGLTSNELGVGDKVVVPSEFVGAARSFLEDNRLKWSGVFVVRDVVWRESDRFVVLVSVEDKGVLAMLECF